jgi:predicted nuclease of predicted toxin-antitoxin system
MRLYIDDDLAQPLLAQLLRNAGHDVVLPITLGLAGREDPVHLRHAVRDARVFLSGNHDDFEQFHNLIIETQGHHPGILIVRRDNNPKRDLGPRGIVRAMTNLVAANVDVEDQFLVLNHWR